MRQYETPHLNEMF